MTRPITVPPVVMEEPADGFPDGIVGVKGEPQPFKLVNKGDSETEVVKLSIQGEGDFRMEKNECSGKRLAGKTTCGFTVVFTPKAPGRIAALQVKLVGSSRRHEAGRNSTGPALLKLSPNAADSAHAVGSRADRHLHSDQRRRVDHRAGAHHCLVGPSAPQFAIAANNCIAPLPGGGSCTIGLRFQPTSAGGATAVLEVNGPGTSATARLSGKGMVINPPVPTPSALSFDGRPVGDASLPETLTLHNAGVVSTGMLALNIKGVTRPDFRLVNNSCAAPLPPNGTCMLQVVFQPKAIGERTAALWVTAGAGGKVTAALMGSTLLNEIPRVERRRPNIVNGGWALLPSDDEGTGVCRLAGSPGGHHPADRARTCWR